MTTWLSGIGDGHRLESLRAIFAPVGNVLASQHARLRPMLAQASLRWRGLSSRERKQVWLMLAVVLTAVVWLLFTKPALDTLRYWNDEMPRLRSQAAALREILGDTGGVSASRDGGSVLSLDERVSASLDEIGLVGTYQLREDGAQLVVTLEQPVETVQLVTWLLNAPAGLGLAVQQVTLQRDVHGSVDQGSRVTAILTLVERQKPGMGT